jgi:hypothetical protein
VVAAESVKRKVESIPGGYLQIVVFLLAAAIVVSRRPDAVLNAQFWAEDGKVWYANAYNAGIRSLLWSQDGYFQSFSRLTATLAQCVSLARAPLVFNLTAIVAAILPLQLLVSCRFSQIASIPTRLLLGFLYLALPNSAEIHANVTNGQWYLALLAFMVVVSARPTAWGWRCFDLLISALCSLSGPFAIMLTPLAGILWCKRRQRWRFAVLLTLASGSLIQGLSILYSTLYHAPHFQRAPMNLGATPALFATILAQQVFLGPLVGQNALCLTCFNCAVLVVAIGMAPVAYALLKAPLELELFVVFSAMLLAASLAWPQQTPPVRIPAWQALALRGGGARYFFLPMLVFVATLVWTLNGDAPRILRSAAAITLTLMCFGIVRDWHCPAFTDLNFQAYVSRFESSPPGAVFTIPLNPPGWSMQLVKH